MDLLERYNTKEPCLWVEPSHIQTHLDEYPLF